MPKLLRDIRDELREFPRNPRKYPRLPLQSKTLESRPQLYHNSIMYRAVVKGETANYVTSVQFWKIDFQSDKDESHSIPIKADGKLMYYKCPSVGRNAVKIKCSCEDFRYRWEYPLFQEGGLIGQFRKYTRKTPPPPAGAPYANPDEFLGYCKHVHSLLLALRDSELVTS
jgi:hypothetical protein